MSTLHKSRTDSRIPANARRHGNARRNGAVIAELAICIPAIVLISMSLIELSSYIFVRQSLAVAAYEAGHRALLPAATANDAINTANEILADRRVQGASITVTPNDLPGLAAGQLFTVRITAPAAANSLLMIGLLRQGQLEAEVVVMKEFEAN
jgi:hypothetical protein